VRLRSIEEVLEWFEVRTPAGKIFEEVLVPAMAALGSSGLDLGDSLRLRHIVDAAFVQGTSGLSSARCNLKLATQRGDTLQAALSVVFKEGKATLNLSNVKIGSESREDIVVEVPHPGIGGEGEYEERLAALVEVVGEDR
jgi:hypothetical protein